MEKREKISLDQVKEFIEKNGPIPIEKIARAFDCSPDTVRSKIKKLRKEGEPLIPTAKGIYFADQIKKIDDAFLLSNSGTWIISMVLGMALIASIEKKPLIESIKLLQKHITKEEQQRAKKNLFFIKSLLDVVEIEAEFEPLQLEGRK